MLNRFFPVLRPKGNVESARQPDLFSMMEPYFSSPFPARESFEKMMPAVDVSETEQAVLVNAELPGLEAEDVELHVENNYLVLRGVKKEEREEKKKNAVHRECSYGSFSRSIPLPAEIQSDKVTAKFKNGVLKVTLPKSEKAQTKRISIES
ncbi:Hsp20/alpha crystallin family protein [Desulfonatronum lacustre]|uniref:Hsp20/alpha crystallin family protein n=1 Tax=Desulfonatronum lacustre TaxID=66849 RepID=UPI0004907415|nr:Hsp20/alpha crystallin family protein [Desulfonatronum lacustre]